ncbi:MAG: amidase [Acidimicrobiales bacterium]
MGEDVELWSASRQAAAIRRGELSSTELLERMLARIGSSNAAVNAVVTLDEPGARAAAAAADDAARRGEWSGPLHGLPITIKDALEVGGMRSTGGAVELTDHVPVADAPVVAAVRAAGAFVIGKTNVPRWSGDIQTYNEVFGTTSNPWALDRGPGGSSGGAAAAVACGMTAFEIGTDIGGSIRNPAHFVGIFGHKPSFGLVPQRGYLDHVGGGITDVDIHVVGPLARSAEDLELVLGVVAGPPPELRPAWKVALPDAGRRVATDFRVAVWFDEPSCPLASGVRQVLDHASERLAAAGAAVSVARPPVSFDRQRDLFLTMIAAAVSVSAPAEIAGVMGGSHHGWLALAEERARLQAVWAEWFLDFDAVLCPVMPTAAFAHHHGGAITDRTIVIDGVERPHLDLLSWLGVIGVVGLPASVAPLGLSPDGLPVGVQVVAPYLRDLDAIRLAGILAEVSEGGYRPPPILRAGP